MTQPPQPERQVIPWEKFQRLLLDALYFAAESKAKGTQETTA